MSKPKPKTPAVATLPTAGEILNHENSAAIEKFHRMTLRQQLDLVLATAGEDRVNLLFLSNRFQALVQAMPAPEILFTVEEAGLDMALPILAATNHEQFTFLTDFLCWNKEEINPQAIIDWLQILVECGEEKIQEWLAKVDSEWLILILKSLVNIYKCDDEGNPPEPLEAGQLYTIDGMYYFEFLHSAAIDSLETILSIFRDEDPDGFRGILEAAIWTDGHEMQLFAAHFRQSRLSEWGFPAWDEATEIYQYFPAAKRRQVVKELEQGLTEWAELRPIIRSPIKQADEKGFLALTLQQVDDGKRTARFSRELVLLANKVQVADGLEGISAAEKVRQAAIKAMGYVTLGLAELSANNPLKAAALIGRVHTERLFQVGFSQVQDVHRAARALVKHARLATMGIDRLVSPDREIFLGLLAPQPKFFQARDYSQKLNYVDFQEPEQIMRCRDVLQRIERMVAAPDE